MGAELLYAEEAYTIPDRLLIAPGSDDDILRVSSDPGPTTFATFITRVGLGVGRFAGAFMQHISLALHHPGRPSRDPRWLERATANLGGIGEVSASTLRVLVRVDYGHYD